MNSETWVEMEEGSYEINSNGQIRRFKYINNPGGSKDKQVFDKALTPQKYSTEDLCVNLVSKDKKIKRYQVARLVAKYFHIPKQPEDRYVAYKDGNRNNVSASNLYWTATRDLNVKSVKAKPVQCVETGEVFKSKYGLAKQLGVSTTRIRQVIVRGQAFRGYHYREIVNNSTTEDDVKEAK